MTEALNSSDGPTSLLHKLAKEIAKNDTQFRKNEEVMAFDGIWMFEATILTVQQEKKKNYRYEIHYNGWSDSEDEIVSSDRLMKATKEVRAIKAQIESLDPKFNQGLKYSQRFSEKEKVFVYSGSLLYGAEILEVEDNGSNNIRYKVHYYGWNKQVDEWLESNRLFKRTKTSEDIKAKLQKSQKCANVKVPRKGIKHKRNASKKIMDDNFSVEFAEEHCTNLRESEFNIQKELFSYPANASRDRFPPRNGLQNITTGVAQPIDNFEPYVSKRSLAKSYDSKMTGLVKKLLESEAKNKELEAQIEELKYAAIYHSCQRCKKHYQAFGLHMQKPNSD